MNDHEVFHDCNQQIKYLNLSSDVNEQNLKSICEVTADKQISTSARSFTESKRPKIGEVSSRFDSVEGRGHGRTGRLDKRADEFF